MPGRSTRLLAPALAMALPLGLGLIPPLAVSADPGDPARAPQPEEPPLADPEMDETSGCDAAAGGEVDELVADQPQDRTIAAATPTRWRTTRGRQCQRYHGRIVCDGPRRVPEAFGPAAELARTLLLDDERRIGGLALNGPPQDAWLTAVTGDPEPETPAAGLLWPVPDGRLWRGFGRHRVIVRRRGGRLGRGRRQRLHRGVDIGAEAGSAIRAVNDGLVLYSFNGMRGYGNSVILLHRDGSVTLYAHCRATLVFAGQRVRRGEVIAEVGHTGLAHGDHLHFEWRRNGRARNPAPHFVGTPERPATADGA